VVSLTANELAAISAVGAALSGLGAAAAAIGVFMQARTATEAQAGQLFVDFSARYNDERMAGALKALAAWYLSTPDDRVPRWIDAKRAGEAQAIALNQHRRLVSRFYFDVARLYLMKLIGARYAKQLLENNGLNIFYDVCEPMNAANHPARVTRYSRALKRICSRYGRGGVHATPPPAPPRMTIWQRWMEWWLSLGRGEAA
jgi:hypothetical protein